MVNMVRRAALSDSDLAAAREGRLDRDAIAGALGKVGLSVDDAVVDGLLDEAAEHAERVALEAARARATSPRPGARSTSCRRSPRASTSARCTGWRTSCASRGRAT